MPSNELAAIVDPIETMANVGLLTTKGWSVRKIALELSLPNATVKQYIESWKESLSYSDYAVVKAQDALFEADLHYTLIKERAWGIAEEAKQGQSSKDEVSALKLAMDSETRRVEMLHKAGMMENAELASQMLETERKQTILADIIRNVVCPTCRTAVSKELSKISGNVEQIG